jgi:hypothetical protein
MFNTCVLSLYEIEWVNKIELEKENMIIRCMLVACWFDKTRKRHSKYVKKIKE